MIRTRGGKPDLSSVAGKALAPRCGKPMALDGRAERGGPVLEDELVCGRREKHRGPCRSEAAVARYRRADLERWQDRGRRQRHARLKDAARGEAA